MYYTLGQIIKIHREKAGITQQELANRLGIKLSELAKIEEDTVSPTLDTFKKLCEVLNIPLTKLLADYIVLGDDKILHDNPKHKFFAD